MMSTPPVPGLKKEAAAQRYVLVTHFYPSHGGGVELVAKQVVQRIAQDAHVTWCASDVDPAPSLPGVLPVPMRTWNIVENLTGSPYPIWFPGSLVALAKAIRSADALHIHDGVYFGSFAASFLARIFGKRVVLTQHIGEPALKGLAKLAFKALNAVAAFTVVRPAKAVTFISPAVKAQFESILGKRSHFRYVPNGVDTDVFRPRSEDSIGHVDGAMCRSKLGFDADKPLLLFVGRFVPVKRLKVIQEIATLRPDWQWAVIGRGIEDPRAWGLENVRVIDAMPQSDLVEFYRAADFLVLPSISEGFPLVVQEAMACGIPACMTAKVAAGASLPADLFVELPDGPTMGQLSTRVIEGKLSQKASQRQIQRTRCVEFARSRWDWNVCAQIHRRMLDGSEEISEKGSLPHVTRR